MLTVEVRPFIDIDCALWYLYRPIPAYTCTCMCMVFTTSCILLAGLTIFLSKCTRNLYHLLHIDNLLPVSAYNGDPDRSFIDPLQVSFLLLHITNKTRTVDSKLNRKLNDI